MSGINNLDWKVISVVFAGVAVLFGLSKMNGEQVAVLANKAADTVRDCVVAVYGDH